MKILLVLLAMLCSGCFLSEQIEKSNWDLGIINSIPLSQANCTTEESCSNLPG